MAILGTFPAQVIRDDGKVVRVNIDVTAELRVTKGGWLAFGVRVMGPSFLPGEMLEWAWLDPSTGKPIEPSLLLSAGDEKLLLFKLPTEQSELPFRFVLSRPRYEDLADGYLMLRVRDFNDEAAYNELYRRHSGKTWKFFRWMTGSATDADDLNQELWIKIWAKRRTFR